MRQGLSNRQWSFFLTPLNICECACVGSSMHTPVKYTHVHRLPSPGWDSCHFHGCDGSKHQSVSQSVSHPAPAEKRDSLLKAAWLKAFFPASSCPPLTPTVLSGLGLAIWPTASLDVLPPGGQLWACIRRVCIATVWRLALCKMANRWL